MPIGTRIGGLAFLTTALLFTAGCKGGGSSPTGPTGNSPAPSGPTTTGTVVSALDSSRLGGITLKINNAVAATSEGNGDFTVRQPASGNKTVVLSGSGYVDRETGIAVPGAHATISLIPSSFDLSAFDQMFRPSVLTRWVNAPALTVLSNVMTFTSSADPEFVATSEQLTQAEIDGLLRDLQEGLSPLTGGRFGSFAPFNTESVAAGARVAVQRPGQIVVGRYKGLTGAVGFQGLTRWSVQSDGTVTSAIMFLDRDYEKSPNATLRALRMHELGHALGYAHVVSRPSIMNPAAAGEPNDWDRQAAALAFQRPPGNRSPDIDPNRYSNNEESDAPSGPIVWHEAVP